MPPVNNPTLFNVRSSNRIQSVSNKGRHWAHPNNTDVPRPPLLPYQSSGYVNVHPSGNPAALYEYQLPVHDNQMFNHFIQQQSHTPSGVHPTDANGTTRDNGERPVIPNNQILVPPVHMGVPSSAEVSPGIYDTPNYPAGSQSVDTGILPHPQPLITSPLEGNQSSNVRKPHPRRYELCKNYLVNGVCPFGEKCWFVHSDDKVREPLVLPVNIPGFPQPNSWQASGYVMDHYGPQPQSSLMTPSWRFSGNRHGVMPMVRPGFPVVGQGSPMMFQPYVFPTSRFLLPNNQMFQNIADPVLRFKLLSVILLANFQPSHFVKLAVRADHLYLGVEQTVYDYRILFGGYGESYSLSAEYKFQSTVSCLHSSKMQPLLVIVGLSNGSIYCWDPRKSSASPIVAVHESIEVNLHRIFHCINDHVQSDAAISALSHFTTTIEGAQVVVAGNAVGQITWYIAQPPMKTYTVLSSTSEHSSDRIVSLQVIVVFCINPLKMGKFNVWC